MTKVGVELADERLPQRSLFVYVDIDGKLGLVGRLWTRDRRGRETASFA